MPLKESVITPIVIFYKVFDFSVPLYFITSVHSRPSNEQPVLLEKRLFVWIVQVKAYIYADFILTKFNTCK